MSVLRWILGLLLVLAALVVASLTAEPDSWHGAVDWARKWRHTVASEKATCPVLLDEPTSAESSAAEPLAAASLEGPRAVYSKAAALARSIRTEDREALREMLDAQGAATPSAAEAMAVVARVPADALLELRRAARMTGTVFVADQLGARDHGLPLLDLIVLCDALLVSARYAEDDDRRVSAWLDALATGWDLAGLEHVIGEMVGLLVVERALQVADEAWLRRFSRDELAVIAGALAKVDEAMPETTDLRTLAADMLLRVDEVDELQPIDIHMRSVYQAWRNMFSLEDAAIERIGRVAAMIDEFQRDTPARESWLQRGPRLQALVDADEQANSDLSNPYLGHVMSSERNRRTSLANLRLLRMAIAILVGEELVLDDPLGDGPLTVAADGVGLVLGSVTPDVEFRLAAQPVPADRGR